MKLPDFKIELPRLSIPELPPLPFPSDVVAALKVAFEAFRRGFKVLL